MKRIGIYPGTFDPVHAGHIAFALQSIKQCRLDQVVFLPETHPRGKQNVTDVTLRSKQLDKTLLEYPALSSLLIPSSPFTISGTLPELQHLFPAAQFTLMIGSDVFTMMPHWPNIDTLMTEVDIAVGLRRNDTVTDMKKIHLPSASITYIELPDTAHLSSRTEKL